MSDTRAEQVAKAFMAHWITDRGVPECMISDKRPQFTSKCMGRVGRMIWAQKLSSPVENHPQSNGVAKRAIRTVEEVLYKSIGPVQKKWADFVSTTELAINTTPHPSAQIAALHLELGYQPNLPAVIDADESTTVSDNWSTRLDLMHKARRNILSAEATTRAIFNKNQTDEVFRPWRFSVVGQYLHGA